MKVVLTGGPSCGKTSIIEYFKRKRQNTVDEAARKIIHEKEWNGKDLTDKEFNELERQVHKITLEKESYADHYKNTSIYFFDRSLVDIDGYCLHRYGHVPKKYQKIPIRYDHNEGKNMPLERYHKVFVLDLLPFKNDGLRLEKDAKEIERLHNCIIEGYKLKGYDPIRVPVIPHEKPAVAIRKRAEWIKNNILGLDTINEEYEKLQQSYSEARRKYNLPRSIHLHVEGYNPIMKKVKKTLLNNDSSW
jgi:predicted ATPase